MKITFENQTVDLTPSGRGFTATIGNRTADVEVIRANREAPPQGGDERLDLLIDGKRVTAYVSSDNTRRWVTIDGQTFVLTKPTAGARRGGHGHHHAAGELTAPMPGQIRAVNISEGETVTKGQTLLIVEAMKMEIRVQASRDGVVKKLFVKQGQTVEREQILVEIEEN
jgi:biotin carboxyl carrier protein